MIAAISVTKKGMVTVMDSDIADRLSELNPEFGEHIQCSLYPWRACRRCHECDSGMPAGFTREEFETAH